MTRGGSPPLTRRALLAATLGGVLTACSVPGPAEVAPSDQPAATRRPATARRATPPPTTQPPRVAAHADLVARYQGVPPKAWGVDVPGVLTRLPGADRVVALTLDACGGPHGSGYDANLIATLRAHRVPATLFLNSRWIDANHRTFGELVADPLFEIGNHGTRHLPLSVSGRSAYGIPGTRSVAEVVDEVAGNQDRLERLLGKPPRFFRSGTAHYDDVAVRIVGDLGELPVGYEVNGDQGATLPPARVERAVLAARPGSIVLAHMNHPDGGTAAGLAAAIPQVLAAGLRFAPLSEYLS